MVEVSRIKENPILSPDPSHPWESLAAFNGCVIREKNKFYLVYRAMSSRVKHEDKEMNLSTIGCAESSDGIHFTNRRQLVTPQHEWEKFGCEDPRVTKLDDHYYILYTALATFPFSPSGIKIGMAKTRDFSQITDKKLVTHFNSKAMALFPEKINGKIAAILTVHTDIPPAKIALAFFDEESQLWSTEYWQQWYANLATHDIHLLRSPQDHLEVGAAPVRTVDGWLLIYSYIKNYHSLARLFGIEAVLLDLNDPLRVIGRTTKPLLSPQTDYELHGNVAKVVFPSGALINQDKLYLYYGAADTSCCLAVFNLDQLLVELKKNKRIPSTYSYLVSQRDKPWKLTRFEDNPIITPIPEHQWESTATFNPAVYYDGKKVHIIYRAMSDDYTSTLGYAASFNGSHLDERLAKPIYVPRKDFEKKARPGNSGCEDPRITKIGDRLYMCYTAFNAKDEPRVAFTSLRLQDFNNQDWRWEEPAIMSLPGVGDKNSCILEEKIHGRFVVFHRMHHQIWIDFLDELVFTGNRWLMGSDWLKMRPDRWDSEKIGIAGPPIKTEEGWLLIYHGLSQEDKKYRLGAMLLELNDPTRVIARLNEPILEPDAVYENEGLRPGTVFSCGACVRQDQLFVYYGGADQVVCVATTSLAELLQAIRRQIS